MIKLLRKLFRRECEYCKEMPMNIAMEIRVPEDLNGHYEAYVWVFAKLIELPGGLCIPINRCPMCGRKL